MVRDITKSIRKIYEQSKHGSSIVPFYLQKIYKRRRKAIAEQQMVCGEKEKKTSERSHPYM